MFRYGVQTSVRKQPTRPTKFKLAYAQNASSRDKVEFGIKSCKKAKIYHKKSNDKFWNPCTYIIMCISMICIYLMKQVNKWQPVGLPTITSGFVKLYAKVKIGTESCQMVKKRNHKFHNRFWNAYSYLKGRIMEFGKYLRTVIPGRRSRKPLATPPAMGYIRRTETVGMAEWFRSFSPHGKCYVSASKPPIPLLYAFI